MTEKKFCYKCNIALNEENKSPGGTYCRNCRSLKDREYREKTKGSVHYSTTFEIKQGDNCSCYFCGSKENLEMHHTNYMKLNKVALLCNSCHKKSGSLYKNKCNGDK